MQEQQLDQKLENKVNRWKDQAIYLDLYNASGLPALVLAGVTAPLAATPFAFIPGLLGAYGAFTELIDPFTGFYTRQIIKHRYGNDKLANIAWIMEAVPGGLTDLIPETGIAHNLYLDDLAAQGYQINDDLYIMPKIYHGIKRIVDGFRRLDDYNIKDIGFNRKKIEPNFKKDMTDLHVPLQAMVYS